MNKTYISANELLSDSFKLAAQIYDSGFVPSLIVGVWRGGAPVGIAVQEYLDYLGMPTDHIAIRTSFYTDIDQQKSSVRVDGLDYVIDCLDPEHQMLIVDDVFDTGRSIEAIIEQIKEQKEPSTDLNIRVACPWYKPTRNVTNRQPDYYLHETEDWLVFPHELKGLTREELRTGKGELAATLLERL